MLLTEFLNSYTGEVRKSEIHSSMTQCRKNMSVEVREVEFKNLRAWSFNTEGDLVHESGKFFRIILPIKFTFTAFSRISLVYN